MKNLTNEQLTELLTLAFEKLAKGERDKQAVFNEIANYPDRKMRDSQSIPKLMNPIKQLQGSSTYEHFKSILQ